MTHVPDFIIIGAMKCATTTLQVQLAAQPGVFMTTPKEPNYFSDDPIFAKGPTWYHDLFKAAPDEALKGEASTHYTKLPTYPQTIARMQAALDSPKLVYMIRNPLTRAVSHYMHEWSQGNMGRDIEAAFAHHTELVDYGRYGMQVSPFIEAFGAENVLLTSLEQIKATPDAELARVAAHIGLAGPVVWKTDLGAQNVSAERVRRLPLQGLIVDNPIATFLRRTLVPKGIREKIRKTRTYGDRPELSQAQRQKLQAQFLADRDVLASYFPDHPALRLCYPFDPT